MNWITPFEAVGRGTIGVLSDFGRFSRFIAQTGQALWDVRTWLSLTAGQMRKLGVNSLPIALFLSAFTGIVLALQASYTFTGAIPLYFVGTLVGKTMMLELGPVLTGLAMSGRVGANIAAELGTMRVSEQIDALETMAYNPHSYLVLPRVIAGTLMVPIIVTFSNVIGIACGWVTAMQMLDMSSQQFVLGLRLFFDPFDITYYLIKSVSFGFVITILGCYQGFYTEGGAEGVGVATTRAVVLASVMILVLDAFWAATLLQT
ncbi:MlaE family ABC transporter permease [Longimicrobium terrae]|uniref:Phospholipid/cholesterol/gamma-HCH transport system permease protein n=1 Tax=Longimicrobium terrae TaxID=1639882 RepID=A0A841H1H9_9BACT|nr:ABC transporter permease [Longimicrobium terrae]MBB4637444.1 phospholipid/cholesterol/gamma-HCH transport system permease protein [Longimicrobium terrae]MBB6071842.1 phospholipid/cholesterol/gamma-HCH transport system permease protein [Longimicrobium terrae]NNC30391.1 ABC transporter permease [Longimicrobium terrae]